MAHAAEGPFFKKKKKKKKKKKTILSIPYG
jgi:hypothetical protein